MKAEIQLGRLGWFQSLLKKSNDTSLFLFLFSVKYRARQTLGSAQIFIL